MGSEDGEDGGPEEGTEEGSERHSEGGAFWGLWGLSSFFPNSFSNMTMAPKLWRKHNAEAPTCNAQAPKRGPTVMGVENRPGELV